MDLRFARSDDIEEIAALWCDAFPGTRTIADRARMLETGGRYGGLETVLVTRDPAGRLAGACKIYRMTQHLHGAALPMMGLAAVAVAPYARRRGLGAELCAAALREGRARGDVLSTLYPFRPSYYERFGWGLVGRLLRHRFRTAHLPAYDEARHVRVARLPDDADAIAACYARVAAPSNGPIARDRRIWAYRLSGQELGVTPVDEDAALAGKRAGRRQRVVVCDGVAQRGVTGYAILSATASAAPGSAGRAERRIHVRELVAEDETAYRALLGHLAEHREEWPLGVHVARPEERFGDRLEEPRPPRYRESRSLYFRTATLVRGPMLRILDVPAVLRARRIDAPAGARITLRVEDAQVPANSGSWTVEVGSGGAENEVSAAGEGNGGPTVEVRLPALAQILAGDLSIADAARLGSARVTGDAAAFERAFAAPTFWLPDEF